MAGNSIGCVTFELFEMSVLDAMLALASPNCRKSATILQIRDSIEWKRE